MVSSCQYQDQSLGATPQGTKLGNLLFCIAVEDIEIEGGHEDGAVVGCVEIEGEGDEEEHVPSSPACAAPQEYRRENFCSTPANLNDAINPNFARETGGMKNKKGIIRDNVLDRSSGIIGEERNSWALMYFFLCNDVAVLAPQHVGCVLNY